MAEGATDNLAVNTLRARQQRNLLATLFLSHGVPMLPAGDELGRAIRCQLGIGLRESTDGAGHASVTRRAAGTFPRNSDKRPSETAESPYDRPARTGEADAPLRQCVVHRDEFACRTPAWKETSMRTTSRTHSWFQIGSVLTAAASIVVATALPAAATVTLSPSSGPPGTAVTASGSSTSSKTGVCKTVDVYFGATQHSDGHVVAKGTKVASSACDTVGKYSVPFRVPDNARKGDTQVLVVGKDAGDRSVSEEAAKFTVT